MASGPNDPCIGRVRGRRRIRGGSRSFIAHTLGVGEAARVAAADGGLRQQSSHIGTPSKKRPRSRAPDELAASMAGVRSSLEAALARQAPLLLSSSGRGHSLAARPPEVSSHAAISRVAQQATRHRR